MHINPRIECLPDNTAKVLVELSKKGNLNDFTLIGGTAIALHAGHRLSEDIDLACTLTELPRKQIRKLIEAFDDAGHHVVMGTSESVRIYWENEGGDIDDHQQDWIIDGVKVTFMAADTNERGNFLTNKKGSLLGNIPVMSMDGLFELRSRVLTKRTFSRDGFDIWYFLDQGGRSLDDVFAYAKQEDRFYSDDLLYRRLSPQTYPKPDPGFETRNPNYPQNQVDLGKALQVFIDEYQQRVAADVLNEAHETMLSPDH
jgi:predicted nucleotidyltransferase component of viral defense system